MVVWGMRRRSTAIGRIAGYRSAEKQAFGRAAHCRHSGDLEGERRWLAQAEKWRAAIDELKAEFTAGSLGANLANQMDQSPDTESTDGEKEGGGMSPDRSEDSD